MTALLDTESQISALTEGFFTRNGVEDLSTEEFDEGCLASQVGLGEF